MPNYITNSVIVRLHCQKVGQNNSQKKTFAIMLVVFLIVMPLAIYNQGDGGQVSSRLSLRVGSTSPTRARAVDLPSSSLCKTTKFPIGYVGKIRVVRDSYNPIIDLAWTPGLYVPVPDVLCSGDFPDNENDYPLSTDCDFGLSDPVPMWKFTSRGLPSGYRKERVSLPLGFTSPRIEFVNPRWPSGVHDISDTVKVFGVLTCLSNGRLSITSVNPSHRELGFAESVRDAIRQGHCDPARDAAGQPISVRYRYQCLFVQGATPSVNVGRSINAKIKEE